MPSSAVMPVCSRLLPSPLGLRARPPLVWRPSAAISAGSHRASRPASPSAPCLAALSGHLCGLAPHHSPCEPVHSSSGGPQWPSPRARAFHPACEPVRPASGGPQRPSPRARPCQPPCEPVHSSSGGPQRPSPRARAAPGRPASPSDPRLAALSGHLCGLAPSHPACEPVRPSSGGPQRPSPRARAVPFHRAILSVKQLMQKFFAPLKQ